MFGLYGSFYGIDEGGLMWSEYSVNASQRDTVSPVAAVQSAARDLLQVVQGSTPLRNALANDLKNVKVIAIDVFYREYADGKCVSSERCASLIFPITELNRVAEHGPDTQMSVLGEIGANERIFDFAKRWRKSHAAGSDQGDAI